MATGTATSELITKAQAAREASKRVRMLSTEQKNSALRAIADALEANCPTLLEANARDLEAGRESGLSEALMGRLLLNEQRISGMANDVRGKLSHCCLTRSGSVSTPVRCRTGYASSGAGCRWASSAACTKPVRT